ncbi:MAG: GNAT family N-acetyltransferase [Lachnotalea sp.]
MRYIKGNDEVFGRLVKGNNEILFNLFYSIRNNENAFMVTDDNLYIIVHSNLKSTMWIFLNKIPDIKEENEICSIIYERLEINNKLKINASELYIKTILDKVSSHTGINYYMNMPMNVYACYKINAQELLGHVIMPRIEHKEIMTKFITEMVYDAENITMSDYDACSFANAMVDSENLFLWKNTNVVSMAMIAHKTAKYARINTVFTDRKQRGIGYAGMLVGEISNRLLSKGTIPMLYADARNLSSNAVYQRIGYEKQGEITEYIFC